MKIVLICFAGMSTSMLVSRMKKVAVQRKLDAEITAMPTSEMYDQLDDADVILLGPQARYAMDEVKGIVSKKGTPVEVIDSRIYGMMNGEAILDMALKLIKK